MFCVAAGGTAVGDRRGGCIASAQTSLDYAGHFCVRSKAFELARRLTEVHAAGLIACSRQLPVRKRGYGNENGVDVPPIRGQDQSQVLSRASRSTESIWRRGVAAWSITAALSAPARVYHMRHTALRENRLVQGQPERGVELARDLERICRPTAEKISPTVLWSRPQARAAACRASRGI